MQVVERGLIGLDDDVGEAVPELAKKDIMVEEHGIRKLVKASKPITLREGFHGSLERRQELSLPCFFSDCWSRIQAD